MKRYFAIQHFAHICTDNQNKGRSMDTGDVVDRLNEAERALGIMWHLFQWAVKQSDADGDAISNPEQDAMGIAKAAYEALDIEKELA
jgi:hypothetical protein